MGAGRRPVWLVFATQGHMSLGRWSSGWRMTSDPGEGDSGGVWSGGWVHLLSVIYSTWGWAVYSASLGVQGWISGLLGPSWLGSIADAQGGCQVTRWWDSFRGALVWGDPECQEERLNPGHYPRVGGKI